MWINLLFALCGAVGVFCIIISFNVFIRKKSVDAVDRVTNLMEEEKSFENLSFYRIVRKYGFSVALTQADLDITPAGFWRTGIILSAIVTLIAYLITVGPVAIFVGLLSFAIYLNWLFTRRDKRRTEYDEALASVADALASGAHIYNALLPSIRHAVELAPDVIKGDLEIVSSKMSQSASVREAFQDIQNKRKSFSLDLLVDTVIMWESTGTGISLGKALEPLTDTIREMSSTRKEAETQLSSTRWMRNIVCVFPLFIVLFVRSSMPGYDEACSSLLGQVFQLIAYLISASGYILSERFLGAVSNTLNISEEVENVFSNA